MSFEVTILGCGSATPTSRRNPSAQIINMSERFFLIDCGEGAQMQIRRVGIKFQRINHIFISHLHGDHYLGLLGLLSTMHLFGRNNPIHIYCHKPLKEIIDIQLKASETYLNFEINYHFHEKGYEGILFEDQKIKIECFQLNHRIPCVGFLFSEKQKLPNLKKEMVDDYKIPSSEIGKIKNGADFITESGELIPNNQLVIPAPFPRSYAYCSDTVYMPNLAEKLKKVNLVYHEATFTKEMSERAKDTFHTTAEQAAELAKSGEFGELMLGHFSARYKDLNGHLEEARAIFQNSFNAEELKTFEVKYF